MNLLAKIKYVTANRFSAFFYTPPKVAGAKSFFFKEPVKRLVIDDLDKIEEGFIHFEKYYENGYSGYSLIPYESGYIFEERLQKFLSGKRNKPLFEFVFFDNANMEVCLSKDLDFSKIRNYSENNSYSIDNFCLNTDKESYCQSIDKIKKYIEEGDTYQVNYTVKGKFKFSGDPVSLIYNLIYNQSAKYTAVINLGDNLLLSLSPELFFIIEGNNIKVKPMKGTIKRGLSLSNDNKQKMILKSDEKNRAENVMIVDLLRNDLGKICEYDSVKTTSMFDIETYETLHQMTSTVEGKLKRNNIYEVLKNIFPSGSITGAPKLRTMEIIKELEKEERGYYTGAIGLFANNKIIFNIPIRTISIDKNNRCEIGIGSGVVWDSNAEEEYNETLLKADFLKTVPEKYELFETMLYESGEVFLLEYHKNRIRRASEYFLFNYDENNFEKVVNEYLKNLDAKIPHRIKVIMNKWGELKLESNPIKATKNEINKLMISDIRTDETNRFLYFKTTSRSMYDSELKNAKSKGYDEVLFLNKKNEITEGSFTNIFLKINDNWYTPKTDCGLLNGCYREYLLYNESHHFSKKLDLSDLLNCDVIKCVNSLRKEMKVSEIYMQGKLIKKVE